MSNSKFTQGPWSIWTSHHEIADTGDYYDESGVKDKNGRQLCVMCGDLDDDTMQANASLMKTSPEMYENEESNMALLKVLREFIKAMMQEPQFIPLLDSLTTFIDKIDERMVASKQIIKKARGKE